MEITELKLKGVFLIECFVHTDERGKFVKSFNYDFFLQKGLNDIDFKEIYFSVSQKDTIRGMHFQLPPYEHAKLIYLTNGCVEDVILDLRKGVGTYGHFLNIKLNAFENALYIPKGFAHGFKTLENNTIMVYNQTSTYNKNADTGILFDTIGYNWGIKKPIISERDLSFQSFNNFKSPF